MWVKIPVLILLLTVIGGSGSLLLEKLDPPLWLPENPLQRANELLIEGRMEEVLHLVRFSQQYLPADPEFSTLEIESKVSQALDSPWYLLERFVAGALTGEARDAPGLIGTMTLDMLVIGDIRDLLLQGYKEYNSGQGDEVIMALSATGLLLTFAPELSWAPSVFKTFWRGRRFSETFQRQIKDAAIQAQKTGDTRRLQRIMTRITDVIENLGTGPAMTVIQRVETADDLALLARKAKIAPAETYTLASVDGIRALENISTTSAKQGKLIKRVKLSARQQKIFGKALGLLPLSWLVGVFSLSMLLVFYVITRGMKQRT